MKKRITLAAVLALLAVLLTGCGNAPVPTEAPGEPTVVEATTTATESPEEIAYRQAEALLAQKDLEGAAAAFEALGDYADAADRAAEARSRMIVYAEDMFWWESFEDSECQIHGIQMQQLTSGKIRFAIDYTAPEGRELVCFDPPSGDSVFAHYEIPTGERSLFPVDVDKSTLDATPELSFNLFGIYGEEERAFFFGVYPEDVVKFIGREHAPRDPGATVLREQQMEWGENGRKKDKEIRSFTLQELSDGYIRFIVDYTMPQDAFIWAFDPPNGDTVQKFLGNCTGGEGTCVLDVEKSILQERPDITINFYNDASGPFFTAVDSKDVLSFIGAE